MRINAIVAFVLLAVLSWVAGWFGYIVGLRLLFHQVMSAGGRRRRLYIAVSGSLCGLVPTILLGGLWGAHSFTAPEILLFATLFCVASATFALGYATLFK